MDLDKMRESENVEDQRGRGGSVPRGGYSRGGRGAQIGIGGMLLVVVGSLLFGLNPADVLNGLQGGQVTQSAPTTANTGQPVDRNDPGYKFASRVLGDLEDVWGNIFQNQLNGQYEAPKLVLFNDLVQGGCGLARSASGPFYCPADQKAYIDLAFFKELEGTSQSEFARAYVLAHEIGHHVQNLLGISEKVHAKQQQVNETVANQLSVRLELQADCFAGIWGQSAAKRGIIQVGEVEAAIKTAMEIGDDRLQRQSQGYVVPEAFTHGSSEQRARWFQVGLQSGDIQKCNTFNVSRL